MAIDSVAFGMTEDALLERIEDVVSFWGEATDFATWGEAIAAVNAIADSLALPAIEDRQPAGTFVARLNGIIAGLGIPAGATAYWDFVAGRYWHAAGFTAPACSRSTMGYAEGLDGDWVAFAIDEARVTDLGLLVEPAATDISLNPVAGSNWLATMVTSIHDAGAPYLGIFTDPQLVTATSTNANARVRSTNQASAVVSGQLYALTYWLKAGSVSRARLFASGNAGTSFLYVDLADYSIISSSAVRGPMTLIAGRAIGAVHEIKALWTPNFTGGADLQGIGPGTGVLGDSVIVVGFRAEAGSTHYSPSGPASGGTKLRAADVVTLALPSGTHDLTFTFDDDSVQVIAEQAGNYIIPTDLDRRIVKTIVAEASA